MAIGLKDGRAFKHTYRGIKDVGFFWHGEWSDPEVTYEYEGKVYAINYWDVDEDLFDMFVSDHPEYEGKNLSDMTDIINKYAVANADRVRGYLEDSISSGGARVISNTERYELTFVED